jgi:hypothetical protein
LSGTNRQKPSVIDYFLRFGLIRLVQRLPRLFAGRWM